MYLYLYLYLLSIYIITRKLQTTRAVLLQLEIKNKIFLRRVEMVGPANDATMLTVQLSLSPF